MIKPNENIEEITPYKIDKYKNQWRLKLDANENIYGCSPKIISAIKNIQPQDISLYPNYGELIDKLCEKYEINDENILLSNGCDEALNIVINTYINKDDEFFSLNPSFSMPNLYAKATGAIIKQEQYSEKFIFNINTIKENLSKNTKIVYLASPNNPTGEIIKPVEVSLLLKEFKEKLFIVDCTYINYSNNAILEDYIDLTKKYNNIIVMKSFSKDFAIAGLRFGITIADKTIINNLYKVSSPYNVNIIATKCALVALRDEEYFEKIKELNNKAKEFLYNELKVLGFEPYPSEANFILCDFGEYCDFYYEKLKKNGVITRNYSKNSPISNCLRITIPTIGGAKYIIELLKKKDVLIFNLDEIIFKNQNNKTNKIQELFEKLSLNYDFALYTAFSKEDTNDILEKLNIEKYFYYKIANNNFPKDLQKPNPTALKKIINSCPNQSITYLANNVDDVVAANSANINIIGYIETNSMNNDLLNNFKHLGVKYILNNIDNLNNLLGEIKKENEKNIH